MHIQKATAAQNARIATERRAIECSYGCKYAVLFDLPACDIIRLHVVDPMHNLFLGIAKYTTKQWNELGVLNSHDYSVIQDRVDSMCVPSKIGRIPKNCIKLCCFYCR